MGWRAGAGAYEEMTDLPAALRGRLGKSVPFSSLSAAAPRPAPSDGTVKALFETADGRPLEAVLMRYRDGAPLGLRLLAVGLPADAAPSARPGR